MIKMKLVVSGSDSNITLKESFEDQFFLGGLEWVGKGFWDICP